MQNICFNILIINILIIFYFFYRLTDKHLITNKLLLLHRQVRSAYYHCCNKIDRLKKSLCPL